MSVLTVFVFAPAFNFSPWNGVYAVIAYAIIIGVMTLVIAVFLRLLPPTLFKPSQLLFRPIGNERKFWAKLGIRRWKGLIPDISGILKLFSKKTFKSTSDADYIATFLYESNFAEVVHWLSMFAGFFAVFVPIDWINTGIIEVFLSLDRIVIVLPLAFVNAFLNLLPIILQRYNRPVILKIYKRALKNSNLSCRFPHLNDIWKKM